MQLDVTYVHVSCVCVGGGDGKMADRSNHIPFGVKDKHDCIKV